MIPIPRPTGPRIPHLILALVISALPARPGLAQEPARGAFHSSPYLHLHHWAYPYVDLLLERGVLRGLSPVERPYRRVEVAQAVLEADAGTASASELGWLERLRREFRQEIEAIEGDRRAWVAAEFAVDELAATQSHRDVLRAQGAARLETALELDLRLALPGVAAASRLRADSYYRDDPQFRPERVATNRFNQRAEDAYVEVQTRYLRLLVGRLYRNWAPSRVPGTLLSNYAYSYEHLGLRAGTDALSFGLAVARLDDFPGDVRRYIALHRVDFHPSRNLAVYAGEAIVYGGPGREFELDFLNPVSFWFTENENQRTSREVASNNALVGAGFWWRPTPSVILFGDFTLDDVQVDPGAPDEPISYAMYVGLVVPRLGSTASGRIWYTQVSSLAYRTPSDFERLTFRDLGIARDFSDYDLWTAELDLFPKSWLWLTPRLQLLRRGEGDFRQPFPTDFDGVPTLHIGNVETTLRLALGGIVHAGPRLVIRWDAGENFVWDKGHVEGENEQKFVGRLTLRLYGGRGGFLE